MDAEIRRVETGDWEALRDVRLAALADAPDAFFSTLAQEQEFDEQRWRGWIAKSVFFLAWDGARPVGIIGTFVYDDGGWHVISMWASPVARGTGVASQLMDAVIAHLRAQGAPQVSLWVIDGNDRARVLCEAWLPGHRQPTAGQAADPGRVGRGDAPHPVTPGRPRASRYTAR